MCRCVVLWLCGGELHTHLAGEELLAPLQPPGKVEISNEACVHDDIIIRNVPVAAQNGATTWMAPRSMSWQTSTDSCLGAMFQKLNDHR